jgi:hypothetical protein
MMDCTFHLFVGQDPGCSVIRPAGEPLFAFVTPSSLAWLINSYPKAVPRQDKILAVLSRLSHLSGNGVKPLLLAFETAQPRQC